MFDLVHTAPRQAGSGASTFLWRVRRRGLGRILDDEPAVVRLLGPSPIGVRPRIVRLGYYGYRFTTRAERAQSGAWWDRTFRRYLN